MKKTILFIVLATLCLNFRVLAQNYAQPTMKNITGKVTDEQNKPLVGASIIIKGTNTGVITDSNGTFSIENLPKSGFIVIGFIGYIAKELPFDNIRENVLTIQLKPDENPLNEVQVIGYGTTTKRFNTGNVSTVTAAQIENQPVSNPLATLQGQVAGVFVQTQNGLPGGNITIQIRGQGSIASGTDPLYIVDGVPFLSTSLDGVSGASGANGSISPLSIINPGDIESISILKDADATAIYGSRGANGVILITTKKGKSGKDVFTLDMNQGISRISRLTSYLNLQQYLQLRNEAFKNDGQIPSSDPNSPNYAPDLTVWDTTKSHNWQKYFYGGTADVTNIQASLTGGDENTHYLASFNYHQEGTILPGDENYRKGGGYLNIDHTSKDKKFSTIFSVNYNTDDNHTLYSSINNGGGTLPPDFPVYNSDGSYNWDVGNPIAALEQKQSSESTYLNANSVLKYSFTPDVDAKISLGYNNYSLDQIATLPADSQDPAFSPTDVAYFDNNSSERYIIEPQLNYVRHFKDGILTALLGETYQYQHNEGTSFEGVGVSNPSLLGSVGAANAIIDNSDTYSLYKYESLFGRLNYNWQQKYLIDLNLRRDGSSRFGPGRQFGNFYAVAGGWIFSQEDFIKNNLGFISYGKIRSSYGLTGNDQIGDYGYLSTYYSNTAYAGISTLAPSRIANQNYSWETTKKFEAAIELGFLKDRILLNADWYKNTSGNQLISYTTPSITGFSSYEANFPGVVQNTGWEFELHASPVKAQDFSWNSSFNLTLPKNKLVSFPGLAQSSYANSLVVGQDLSIVKAYQFLGVNPQTGLADYKDVNGDGKLSFLADAVVAGKTSPDLYGGFSNSFNYKGFQLDIFFEFVKRSYLGNYPALGSSATNDPSVFVLNRWEYPGEITNIPAATLDASNIRISTAQFTDASYVRLKNLALSYSLKSSVLKHLNFSDLKIYIEGENLFVIANKDRFDPEISGSGFPPLRTLTAGLKLTL